MPGRAPSVTLPLRYLVAAAAAFTLAGPGVVWLAPALAGHYYHPHVLALTHTVTLGWITLTIIGASYQLIPIVLELPIWSERLARWQFVLLVLGVIGMVGHFWIGQWPGLLWGAAMIALGVGSHVLNVALSLRRPGRATFTARLMALALTGLAATVVFGLVLGVNHVRPILPAGLYPSLHAHFHLALLGWVLPMVLGVGARAYPMFLLAHEPDGWSSRLQLWGLGVGVPLVVGGLLAGHWLVVPGAVAVTAAIAGHTAWGLAALRGRRRPALDWGLRFVVTGTAFLVPSTALGLALALDGVGGPRPALGYAVLVLGGWASLTIAGMMLKIVPFLVWYRVYAPRAGHGPVPTLAELSWPRAEATAYVLLTGGLTALAVAVAAGDADWIRAAGLAVTAGALAFAASLGRVLAHLASRGTRTVAGHGAPAPGARARASR